MAIIYQPTLFSWKDNHEIGDLERLKMVMEALPDEDLIQALEQRRKNGRNDYPVRPVWNSLIAKIIYQHPTNESLIRELMRNAQLREVCGFNPIKGVSAVPTNDAYSRFMLILEEHQSLIDIILQKLVDLIAKFLPDFGENVSVDSEALHTFASGRGNPNSKRDERALRTDKRRDNEADWGKKYVFTDKCGEKERVSKTWYGYKLHLICDSKYELPLAYSLTRASTHDGPEAHKLIDKLSNQHSFFSRCNYLMADRGYDDTKLLKMLWEKHGVKGVIDTRTMWREDKERPLNCLPQVDNVTYNEKGELHCYCPKTAAESLMPLAGFEHNRDAIKFRCPATHYGFQCLGRNMCPVANGIRVPLEENRRIFTPVPRNSRNWALLYKQRTSVERVFSRLDTSYGFDTPRMRGKARFTLNISLSLIVALAMAKGRLERKQTNKLCSLVKVA